MSERLEKQGSLENLALWGIVGVKVFAVHKEHGVHKAAEVGKEFRVLLVHRDIRDHRQEQCMKQ